MMSRGATIVQGRTRAGGRHARRRALRLSIVLVTRSDRVHSLITGAESSGPKAPAMNAKTELPTHLHIAHSWTAAAGELDELRGMSDSDAEAYATEAAANYAEHDESDEALDDCDILLLRDWLRADAGMHKTYKIIEDGHEFAQIEALDADDALDKVDRLDASDYGDPTATIWIHQTAVNVFDADDCETMRCAIDPTEPACADGHTHEWADHGPVRGHGGGMMYSVRCPHCGTTKTVDTWAQDPSDGTQGLTSIAYTCDDDCDDCDE